MPGDPNGKGALLGDAALTLENVSRTYGTFQAVDDLSLSVRTGEVFGLLGPNGAGKSTTIRMILGLLAPDAGRIEILGRDAQAEPSAREPVGALVEEAALYPQWSALDHLRLFAPLQGEGSLDRVDALLRLVGLNERATTRTSAYSRGMRQRLGLALALLPDPRLLILDEPTSALDTEGVDMVRRVVRERANEGTTILFSSHNLHEVEQLCDRVAILRQGRLIECGPVSDLLTRGEHLVRLRTSDPEKGAAIAEEHGEALPSEVEGELLVRLPEDRVPALNRALVEAGLDVYEVSPRPLSLEEVFRALLEGAD